MNIMFNRISKFQIRCSVDGNFANHNARCGRLEIAPTKILAQKQQQDNF